MSELVKMCGSMELASLKLCLEINSKTVQLFLGRSTVSITFKPIDSFIRESGFFKKITVNSKSTISELFYAMFTL